ncbi:MAG: hypothetical protein MJ185_00215 [Treponema sp.]|nr:hypothetical protein [Treponema sp.]
MLEKLIKHEFKNSYKVMLAVYAAYVLLTILGSISCYSMASGHNAPSVLLVSVIILYVLSSVAVYISTFVYICIRYYKTMYSAQGYLTHTLPVKGTSVFNAKLIVSTIWMISSVVLLVVSIFFFVNAATQGEAWKEITRYSWSDLNRRLYEEIGIYLSNMIGWMVVGLILGMLLINLWIFTSFAIGQLSDKHKVALSVVAGMVMYFVFQVLGITETITSMESVRNDIVISEEVEFAEFFNSAVAGSCMWALGFCVVMYIVCVYINRKKLNLE